MTLTSAPGDWGRTFRAVPLDREGRRGTIAMLVLFTALVLGLFLLSDNAWRWLISICVALAYFRGPFRYDLFNGRILVQAGFQTIVVPQRGVTTLALTWGGGGWTIF